jgi:hypothetical protein
MLDHNGIFIFYNFMYELHEKQNILLNFIYDMFSGFHTRPFTNYKINTLVQFGYIFTNYEQPNDNLYKNSETGLLVIIILLVSVKMCLKVNH